MSHTPLAILLLAYGGPESLEEVPGFLTRVMGPSRVTPEIVERARRRYGALGGGSPLVENTRAQAGALESRLQERLGSRDSRVILGMRHSPPFLDDGLAQALEVGEGRALGLVMASHQSRGATGGYQDEVLACLERRQAAGLAPGEVDFLPAWHTHPLYLDAVTERAREALGRLSSPGGRPLIVFSAHSLPLREGQPGDPDYETALAETAAGVMERLGDHPWRLAYQSRSLRPGVRWLEPDISAVLEEEALAGRGSVVVVPLGFVVEHLETLYDLDIDLRERAASLGIDFARAATVQDHPLFIEALVDVVLQHLPAAAGKGGNE